MDNTTFPFGEDVREIARWLPLPTTPSRKWTVAYEAGLSMICGGHTMIFFAHDNLQIGVVHFWGCGPSWGIGTKRLTRGGGRGGRIRDRAGEVIDEAENAINTTDYLGDILTVDDAQTGIGLFHLLRKNPAPFTTEVPMSFSDLGQAWGRMTGVNVGSYEAGAQYYRIDISPDVIADGAFYVRDQPAYNFDNGSIGAALGHMQGSWVVARIHDLWFELTDVAHRDLNLLSDAHVDTADIQPMSQLECELHPFIRQLPLHGRPVPETLIRRHFPDLAPVE
jgi:hypothetical protein